MQMEILLILYKRVPEMNSHVLLVLRVSDNSVTNRAAIRGALSDPVLMISQYSNKVIARTPILSPALPLSSLLSALRARAVTHAEAATAGHVGGARTDA